MSWRKKKRGKAESWPRQLDLKEKGDEVMETKQPKTRGLEERVHS